MNDNGQKQVLITGTSSGLGQALATVYLRNHHDVIGTSHQQHHLRDLMEVPGTMSLNCLSMHYEASPVHGDAEELLIEHLIRREVLRSFDVVILNAGINNIVPISELTPEVFHHLLHVNAVAPVQLIRQLLSHELLAPGAVVIAVTSDAAWRAMTNSMAYCASKAALDMAMQCIARSYTKSTGISFINVRPGLMEGTEMSKYITEQVCRRQQWTPDMALEYWASRSVSGVRAQPAEVAGLIYDLTLRDCRPWSGTSIDLSAK